jgi:hypothetical protein
VAAIILAGGLASATIGTLTTLAESSKSILNALNWYNSVGPLIGKTLPGVAVFFAAWVVLHLAFRGKEVNFGRANTVALIFFAVGLLGTFPPFYELFAGK